MKVCITEKPSVARDIANILAGPSAPKRDGFIDCGEYKVTWTFGHLCCLYDLNGNQSIHANVESVDQTYSSYSKKHTFYFYTDSQKVYDDIKLVIEEDLINAGTLNLSETKGWSFQYGVIQLYGNDPSDPSAQYKNCADNGTMKVALNDDGTYELFIEVQNYYNNYMGTHLGTPEKIILNYVGAVE